MKHLNRKAKTSAVSSSKDGVGSFRGGLKLTEINMVSEGFGLVGRWQDTSMAPWTNGAFPF